MIDATAGPAPRKRLKEKHYWHFGLHNTRLGFRRWRRSRPFWGGFWAILGGLIIAYFPTLAIKLLVAAGTTVLVAILVGVLIAIFGLFLWFAPSLRHIVGVLITVLAVVSLITSDFGGFLIGMILAVTGGALGFAWVPTEPRIKKWRTRRLLHLPIPAIQPDLELRGVLPEVPEGVVVGREWKEAAPVGAVELDDADANAPLRS